MDTVVAFNQVFSLSLSRQSNSRRIVVYSRRVIGSFSSRHSLPEREREIQSIIHSFIRRGDSNALVRSRFPPLPFETHTHTRLSTRGLLLCKTMFPFNQFVAAQYRYSKFGRYSTHALSLFLLISILTAFPFQLPRIVRTATVAQHTDVDFFLPEPRTRRHQSARRRLRQRTSTARSRPAVHRRSRQAGRSSVRHQPSSTLPHRSIRHPLSSPSSCAYRMAA